MAELIRVAKDGEVMDVHPDALEEHLRLRWTVAPDAEIAAELIEFKRGPGRPKRTEALSPDASTSLSD